MVNIQIAEVINGSNIKGNLWPQKNHQTSADYKPSGYGLILVVKKTISSILGIFTPMEVSI